MTALTHHRTILLAFCLAAAVLSSPAGGLEASGGSPETHGAQLFEPGKISTGREYGVTFSPDGRYLYFTRGEGIYWTRKEGEGWSSPRLAAFSRGEWISEYVDAGVEVEYFNWDPVISPDGSKLFIMSHGLVNGHIVAGEHGDLDLWVMDRIGDEFDGDSWGVPRHLGAAINSPDYNEGSIGISADGTVYFFSSNRPDGAGKADVYFSRLVDGEYLPAENIGPPINTPSWDGHTYVDPRGTFLLFISNDLPGGFGGCDIYVSRRAEGGWARPENLGPMVNTEKCELTPSVTPDGKTLFFARIDERETDVRNIYRIDLDKTAFRP